MGISLPDFETYFQRFADFLLITRFLQEDANPSARFVQNQAGKVYLAGNAEDPQFVLLHGLPLNSESWTAIEQQYPGKTLRIDLPGLGRSTFGDADFISWLSELLASMNSRPILVGHSVGTAIALELADRHPEKLAGLVLIAPYFLGKAPAKWMTNPLAFRTVTGLLPKKKLLGFIDGEGAGVEQARAQLLLDADSRKFLPAIAYWLSYAWKNPGRLRTRMGELSVPSILIAGELDLPEDPESLTLEVIAGAGHYPQVTHPQEILSLLKSKAVRDWLTASTEHIALAS